MPHHFSLCYMAYLWYELQILYIFHRSYKLRRSGKTKLPDAIIAATALVYDLVLVSRNSPILKILAD
jgi:predicted nucleic acid-binding protein